MKRIVSLILCAVLAIGSVTYKPPKADAVALEITAALVGKVVGVTLISWGMAWAVDKISENMTGQCFGENVAREIQNWLDEEHEGKVIDVYFGGMMPNTSPDPSPTGNVVLTASVAFIAAVSAFGKWLYDKYALAENDSVVVYTDDLSFSVNATWSDTVIDYPYSIRYKALNNSTVSSFTTPEIQIVQPGTWQSITTSAPSGDYFVLSSSTIKVGGANRKQDFYTSDNGLYAYTYDITADEIEQGVTVQLRFNFKNPVSNLIYGSVYPIDLSYGRFGMADATSLSVSAPNGLSISDVEAVTPEQAYALTFEGVTATDVEGIVNEAVGRILDGTYSAAGEITDALDVPQDLTWQEHVAQIWESVKAFPQTISQAISGLFIPDAALVTEITSTFNSKFGWLETIHQLGLDLCGLKPGSQPPVIYIHLEDAEGQFKYGGMEKALDMSWYEPYKEDVDNIISGFMWLAFLWLVFKRAADIINGAGMVSDYEFYGSHPIDQPRLEEHKK